MIALRFFVGTGLHFWKALELPGEAMDANDVTLEDLITWLLISLRFQYLHRWKTRLNCAWAQLTATWKLIWKLHKHRGWSIWRWLRVAHVMVPQLQLATWMPAWCPSRHLVEPEGCLSTRMGFDRNRTVIQTCAFQDDLSGVDQLHPKRFIPLVARKELWKSSASCDTSKSQFDFLWKRLKFSWINTTNRYGFNGLYNHFPKKRQKTL